ncbi:serine/threonine-protein kinase [Streptomyces sp. NPDC006332]|uniref:serine/threonine-protein kinase n=1 Tax=Streptomyces sp. NPDC006332 TaxID=3155456 RepID=UPI0033A55F85
MSETLLAGRYRLVRRLGSGGQGTVYEAWDENLQRTVAVKTLTVTTGGGVTHRAMAYGRFDREARALARLEHPYVVTIHDRGEHEGTPYIVMEFLVGRSLAAELESRGPLPVDEVVRHAGQIAQGLEAAHTSKIAHRDIKPTNLLLTSERRVKICDFGLVTQVSPHAPGYTVRGSVLGSPGYMSPEQAAGGPGDARSDIFSFGVTLYALLVGGSPFAAPDPAAAVMRVLGAPPEPVTYWRPDVPAPLSLLVGRMLERAPERRPGIEEVRGALAALARHATWALGGALSPGASAGPPGPASAASGGAPAARPRAAASAQRLVDRERDIATGVPKGPGRPEAVRAPGKRGIPTPSGNERAPERVPGSSGKRAGAAVGCLAERFWPGLEDAERLLVNKEAAAAEKSFAQISAKLTALSASAHPAFFAALFGRARALDALGKHTTARNRLTRLNDRVVGALGPGHQLTVAVARYLRDSGTQGMERARG